MVCWCVYILGVNWNWCNVSTIIIDPYYLHSLVISFSSQSPYKSVVVARCNSDRKQPDQHPAVLVPVRASQPQRDLREAEKG